MLALISLLAVIVGCTNWLTIGLLQFDFVAGLFGSQSNIFSRIVYVVIGVCAMILTFNIIKNKGRIAFNFRKFKVKFQNPTPAPAESSEEFAKNSPENHYNNDSHSNYHENKQYENSQKFYQPNSNGYMGESGRDNSKNELKGISQKLNDRHNFNKNLRQK